MNGMSRSRHIFAPPELPANSKGKRKEKEDAVEREKIGPVANNETLIGKLVEEEGNFGKKEISAEATIEFLRIIQQSEFKVIEQLNKCSYHGGVALGEKGEAFVKEEDKKV